MRPFKSSRCQGGSVGCGLLPFRGDRRVAVEATELNSRCSPFFFNHQLAAAPTLPMLFGGPNQSAVVLYCSRFHQGAHEVLLAHHFTRIDPEGQLAARQLLFSFFDAILCHRGTGALASSITAVWAFVPPHRFFPPRMPSRMRCAAFGTAFLCDVLAEDG